MEAHKLSMLEKKIVALIELLRTEKTQNERLATENKELQERLETLETSLLKGTQNLEELNQERMLTKQVVDELINSIDKLVEQAGQ